VVFITILVAALAGEIRAKAFKHREQEMNTETSEMLNRKLEEAKQATKRMKREEERGGRPF